MHSSTLDISFVDRLKSLLASRYGKSLQIRQLMDLGEIELESEYYRRGQDLHIPIRVKGSVLGTAVVPSAQDLNQDSLQGVTQLVRMVLEPAMYKWYLDQKESNLVEISKANLELDNVELFAEEKLPSIDELIISNPELLNESPGNQLISHLIHLEGRSEQTNKKVALTLHEMSGRWAFVPFNDIKGQLHSAYDISKLGAMTIYIEKVEDLNEPEQELLMDYINEDRSSDEPLIISCSMQNLEQLAQTNLDDLLLDELSVNTFEVDKAPLTNSSLKEVLELFFMKDALIDA